MNRWIAFLCAALLVLAPIAAEAAGPPQALSPPFTSYTISQKSNTAVLRSTLTKAATIAAGTVAQIRVATWGDSTTNFHAGPLVAKMAAMYPYSVNPGNLAGNYGCWGALPFGALGCETTATSGSVTAVTGDFTQTPTGNYWTIGAGGCVTINQSGGNFSANKFAILYIAQNGAGTLSLNTNLASAGWVTQATANAQNSSAAGQVLTYTAGSAGLYQMQACASGAGPVTVWIAGYENTLVSGVVGMPLGQSGASLAQELTPPTALTAPWFAYLNPDLVTFEMKQNGGGATWAQMQTWASEWTTANAYVDFLMIGSYPISSASGDPGNILQNSYEKLIAQTYNGVYWDGYGPSLNFATEVALGWITSVSSPHQLTLGQAASSMQLIADLGVTNWPTAYNTQNTYNSSVTTGSVLIQTALTGSNDAVSLNFLGGNSATPSGISSSWWNGGMVFSCPRTLGGFGFSFDNTAKSATDLFIDCGNDRVGIGNNTSPTYPLDVTGQVRSTTAFLNSSTAPTLTSCGTGGSVATGSSNQGGSFTTGSSGSPTACTVNFNTAYPAYAFCTITAANSAAASATLTPYMTNNKGYFTVNFAAAATSAAFNYACNGN